jgi:hypothetical protein
MQTHLSRTFLSLLAFALLQGPTLARTLVFKTTQVTEADVALSPNGKHLVFALLGHLFRVPVKGGTAEQLTFGPCYDNDPSFSPDGRRIAFVSDRDHSAGNVFVLDVVSNELVQVTHETHAGHPLWTPDGKAILYLRYLPMEENPRPRSLFAGPALCELRRISLAKDAKPETLRSPSLIKSIFFLSDEQPAWTVVEQEAGGNSFMVRSTTHVETMAAKDGKVSRLRSLQGDIGRVVGSAKGDGFYYRSPQVRFMSLAAGAAQSAQQPGGGSGFGPGGSATRFAVTPDGKTAYQSGRGQLVKVALEGGEREVLSIGAQVKLEIAGPARPNWSPPEVGETVRARSILNAELSPDGRNLTFMAGGSLWQQSLDGKPARRLLKGDA